MSRLPLVAVSLALALCHGAEAARTVRIPPAYLPGSGTESSRADITLTLVDRSGKPVPASDAPNAALFVGAKRLTVATEPVALDVATQDQINGETYYQITLVQGRQTWTRRVQVPQADGSDLTWAEFVGLSAPVSPASTRLLPDPSLAGDAKWVTTLDGQWVLADAPPGSGIPDAPEDGSQYARQDAEWVPVEASAAESDPVYALSPAATITIDDLSDYASAYAWGDHALAGYRLESSTIPWDQISSTPTTCAGYGITDCEPSSAWGSITGALADQADLQAALDARITDAPSDGVPYARQDAAWVAVESITAETDPVYAADPASGIAALDMTHWDSAYAWGDHATAGYLSSESDTAALGALSAHGGAADPHPGYRLESMDIPWDELSGTPTTCAAYGITDCGDPNTDDQTAAEVSVAATPANYSAASADVEAHLSGIDTALGSLGGGHDAVTVTDSSTIDLTLTGQDLTGAVIAVPESAVTDHQSAITITESQISDLGAYLTTESDPTVAGAISAHAGAADPHPTYTTAAEAAAAAPVQSVAGRTGSVTLALADVSGVTPGAIGAEPVGLVSAPATAGDACTAGQRAWDGLYLYSCVAPSTWVRAIAERTW